jgi:aminoglycoside 6'-N-acetyltransferase I
MQHIPGGVSRGAYVQAPYRGRGLARLLCQTLERWAADLGCAEFASDVLLHNEAGQIAHEALSFEETERVVYYVKLLAGA